MKELDDHSPMYTADVSALIEEGLSVKAPLSQEEATNIEFCNSTYIPRGNADSFSNINPLLDQSILSSRAAAIHVFQNTLSTIAEVNKVTGEGSNVSNSKGMGVFIDTYTFANEILGMSGKSKPGVEPQHLSKIWRIDEEAA